MLYYTQENRLSYREDGNGERFNKKPPAFKPGTYPSLGSIPVIKTEIWKKAIGKSLIFDFKISDFYSTARVDCLLISRAVLYNS